MRAKARAERHTRERPAFDGLTGVWNNAGFVAASAPLFVSCKRRGTPVALAYFDLEFESGELIVRPDHDPTTRRVLANTAEQLRRTFRASDVVGRLSPTRFAVLLTDCADDVVATVEGVQSLTDASASFAVNLHVSAVRDDATVSLADLMQQTDARAAQAKVTRL